VPGISTVQFFALIDGKLLPYGFNHTLQGSLENLEPHAVRLAALPGRYALQIQVENLMGTIQVFGGFFNVIDTSPMPEKALYEDVSAKMNDSDSVTHSYIDNKTASLGLLPSLGSLALAALLRRRSYSNCIKSKRV
jgi:hypothetical protein